MAFFVHLHFFILSKMVVVLAKRKMNRETERERAIEKIFMLENKNSNYTGEIKV